MIIFRYLSREILTNMVAVSIALLLIIVSGRFVRLLAQAASGKLDVSVLFTLLGFRLPSFLELIIPLGMFIGILLAYGRLYVDSEMTVLSACGVSEKKLAWYTLITSLFVAAVVGVVSIYLTPMGVKAAEALVTEQKSRTEFETLKPARFHKLSSQDGVFYAQNVSDDSKQLEYVFLAGGSDAEGKLSVMTAELGETKVNQETEKRYLVLHNGFQYSGQPGDPDYQILGFKRYAQFVPEPEYESRSRNVTDSYSTAELFRMDSTEAQAALHWRLSMPLLVMIIALLAVPLSRTKPRKGRYVKMIPAILLYIFYLVCINAARGVLEDGSAPTAYLLWAVHACFFVLAVYLLFASSLRQMLRR